MFAEDGSFNQTEINRAVSRYLHYVVQQNCRAPSDTGVTNTYSFQPVLTHSFKQFPMPSFIPQRPLLPVSRLLPVKPVRLEKLPPGTQIAAVRIGQTALQQT